MAKVVFKDANGLETKRTVVFAKFLGKMKAESTLLRWVKDINIFGEVVKKNKGQDYIYRMMKRPVSKDSWIDPADYQKFLEKPKQLEKTISIDNEWSTQQQIIYELEDGRDFPEVIELNEMTVLQHANTQAIAIDNILIKTIIKNKTNIDENLTTTIANIQNPTSEEAEALFQEIIYRAEKEKNKVTDYEMYFEDKSLVNIGVSPDIYRICALSKTYRSWSQGINPAVNGGMPLTFGFNFQQLIQLDPQNDSYYNPQGFRVLIEIDSLGGNFQGSLNTDKVHGRNAYALNLNGLYGFDANRPTNPSGLNRILAFKLSDNSTPAPSSTITNIVLTNPTTQGASDGSIGFDCQVSNFTGIVTAELLPASGTTPITLTNDSLNANLNFSSLPAGTYTINVKDDANIIVSQSSIVLTDPA